MSSQIINSGSITEYQCPFYKIVKENIRLPNGRIATYYTHVANNPFVAIIAIDRDQVLIQHQFRPTIRQWNWEFPMGAMNDKESPLEAAKRELLEETGYQATNWLELGFFYVGLGHTNNMGFVFLAQDIKEVCVQELEEAEVIKPEVFSKKNLEKMIADGTINDGPTLACWQIYQQKIVAKAYNSYLKK